MVNQAIRANVAVHVEESNLEEAKQKGAMALFGEKYGSKVRSVSMGEFSHEVCGGTHVNQTGQIGLFKIIGQTPSAAGVRRFEAMTGIKALNGLTRQRRNFKKLATL